MLDLVFWFSDPGDHFVVVFYSQENFFVFLVSGISVFYCNRFMFFCCWLSCVIVSVVCFISFVFIFFLSLPLWCFESAFYLLFCCFNYALCICLISSLMILLLLCRFVLPYFWLPIFGSQNWYHSVVDSMATAVFFSFYYSGDIKFFNDIHLLLGVFGWVC